MLRIIEIGLVFEIFLIIITILIAISIKWLLYHNARWQLRPLSFVKSSQMQDRDLAILSTSIAKLDLKFSTDNWENTKHFLIGVHSKKKILTSLKSKSWKKKMFGLEALKLIQGSEYELEILTLLNDCEPLVRFAAAECAIRLATPQSIAAILKTMNREPPYARYYYQDLLMNATGMAKEYAIELQLKKSSNGQHGEEGLR